MLVGKKGLMYPEAYSFIHQRFNNVEHIDELSLEQVPVAIEYIHRLALEGEYIPKSGVTLDDYQLYSIYLLQEHCNWLYEIFKKYNLYTHLSGLGCRAGIEMINHFDSVCAQLIQLKSLKHEFIAVQ